MEVITRLAWGLPERCRRRLVDSATRRVSALAERLRRPESMLLAEPAAAGAPRPHLPSPGPVLEIPGASPEAPAAECWRCDALFPGTTIDCPFCQRPLFEAEVPVLLAGRFRMTRRLGTGGMGITYQAVDLILDRPIAVKTLRNPAAGSADALRHEGRMLAALDHPNLARIHDLLTWQGRPCLILELLPGGTLQQRLDRGLPLATEELLAIALGMARALAHLHGRDLIHRDIKPANIGFSEDRVPKLLDLGLARHCLAPCREAASLPASDRSRRTSAIGIGQPDSGSGVVFGSLHYLSPEVLDGEPPDHLLDLWALGVTLWEAAAGRRLFTGASSRAVAGRIRRRAVPRLVQAFPQLPKPLAAAVDRALHPDPCQRPATAAEMVTMLESVAAAS